MTLIINEVKKYWNNQPCNSKNSRKKFLSRDYFNEIRKKRYFVEKHIPKFAEFKKYKNKNVLEIGCGIGTDGIEFIKHGAKYFGIELSDKSLEIFKKRIEIFNLSKRNPKLILSNVEQMKELKNLKISFDLIYSFGVIHHSPNMKKIFENVYNLSNTKTKIKIMLYAKNSYKNFMLDISNYRYEAQKGCPIFYRLDIKDVQKLINKKFKIVRYSQDFIFPYQIIPYKKNIYKKIKHFEVMPKKIFRRLEEKIGEHLLLELKKF
jgi:SAM-dependent methyltransferase